MKLQGSYKSRMLANMVAAAPFAAMAMPVGVLAQGNHHYKSVDLGTFGGPEGGVNGEPIEEAS